MKTSPPLLVADIGGTNVRFGMVHDLEHPAIIRDFRKWQSKDLASLTEAIARYLEETGAQPNCALFGIAGPVRDGEVRLLNRPDWPVISLEDLKAVFGFLHLGLINDFVAMARSVPELGKGDAQTLFEGTPDPAAPILVAGAGTGFGVATLIPAGANHWTCISGEGGHYRYVPQSDLEHQLAAHLQAQHGYVSNELICGGANLKNVHRALCDIFGMAYAPVTPENILRKAEQNDPLCVALCQIRARAIMGAVGDLALINGARGGIYLAGGISQRLKPYLSRDDIAAQFFKRGPRSQYVQDIPIYLIQSEDAPLIGAAAYYFQERSPR